MKLKIIFALFVTLAVVAVGGTWFYKNHPAKKNVAAAPIKAERKILYYQSAMHPWIKSDKPGKCPICGMDLVPVYAGADSMSSSFGLKLNPDSVNVANVQTAPVERRQIVRTLRVAGDISVNSWTEAWFEFDAYERDLPWLKIGQTIEVAVPAVPGKVFTAEIKLHGTQPYADQNFNLAGASTKVRAEISNGPVTPGDFGPRRLFSGLYAEGRVRTLTPEVLAVPRSAVLSPGPEPVVYVDAAGGRFAPRKIKLGRIGDEFAEVLDGLNEGEKVVVNGNLLLDAETQISQIANQ